MELREFVRESLVEISEGIREAKEAYKKARGVGDTGDNAFHLKPSLGPKMEERGIEFDVAVTIKEGTDLGRKTKVDLLKIVEVSASGASKESADRVSRIKFVVGIHHFLG
jgi:hypothetical protein